MGIVRTLVIGSLIISFVTFIALFGRLPAFRSTPVGYISRLLWIKLPSLLLDIDRRLTGGRSVWYMQYLGHYLMNENHPLILIFYMTILLGSECLFIPPAWPRLSSIHRALVLILATAPVFFTYKCVMSTSSSITPQNHEQQMRQYPYDHILFQPSQMCRTCQLIKPARSKHCSVCKACIAKHDHHCVWVMNCLGKDNYAFFIEMLLSLTILLGYGAYLAYMLLDEFVQSSVVRKSQGTHGRSHWSVGRSWSQRFELAAWAFSQEIRIGAIGMLALLTAPLTLALFLYHMYLIWAGMTTNESFKWSEWKDDVEDGLVFKRDMTALDEKGSNTDTEPKVAWLISGSQRLENRARRQHPHPAINLNTQDSITKPKKALRSSSWQKVGTMREVQNIYDLGFWNNMKDALSI